MYKSKLQELCHQKQWRLPNYSSIKDGPDHSPGFKASVLVNGVSFDTSNFFRSSKDAQNEAARLAFNHFTSPGPPFLSQNLVQNNSSSSSSSSSPVSSTGSTEVNGNSGGQGAPKQQNQELQKKATNDGSSSASTLLNSNSAGQVALSLQNQELQKESPNNGDISVIKDDMQSLHKNQLQNYAQRRNLSLPLYSCVRKGPPHNLHFKAEVTIDGQTFEGPEFCRTLKEAEHAAARVALTSLLHDGIEEDESGFYKNLLQDFLQKEGLSLPTYKTDCSGSSHLPTFISIVEIGGDVFQGIAAKTKKQAEMNAAKVAYTCLKERKLSRNPPFLFQSSEAEEANQAIKYTSSTPHSTFNVELQQNIRPGDPLILTSSLKSEEHRKGKKGSNEEADSSKTIADSPHHSMPSSPKPGINSTPRNKESDMIYACLRDPFPSPPSLHEDSEPSSPTTVSQCSDSSLTTNLNTERAPEMRSSLLCNRVRVYPRKPDMVFPKGVSVMPISDDKWVAVSLDFPSQEGK